MSTMNLDTPTASKERLRERFARYIIAFGPRSLGLVSVILLSVGINVVTSLPDVSRGALTRIIVAAGSILGGVFFFIVSSSIEVCFERAKEVQRKQVEAKRADNSLSVAPLHVVATDNLATNTSRLIVTGLAFCLGAALLAVVVAVPIFEFWTRQVPGSKQAISPSSSESEKSSSTPQPIPSAADSTPQSSNRSATPVPNANVPERSKVLNGPAEKKRHQVQKTKPLSGS